MYLIFLIDLLIDQTVESQSIYCLMSLNTRASPKLNQQVARHYQDSMES